MPTSSFYVWRGLVLFVYSFFASLKLRALALLRFCTCAYACRTHSVKWLHQTLIDHMMRLLHGIRYAANASGVLNDSGTNLGFGLYFKMRHQLMQLQVLLVFAIFLILHLPVMHCSMHDRLEHFNVRYLCTPWRLRAFLLGIALELSMRTRTSHSGHFHLRCMYWRSNPLLHRIMQDSLHLDSSSYAFGLYSPGWRPHLSRTTSASTRWSAMQLVGVRLPPWWGE